MFCSFVIYAERGSRIDKRVSIPALQLLPLLSLKVGKGVLLLFCPFPARMFFYHYKSRTGKFCMKGEVLTELYVPDQFPEKNTGDP